MRIHSDRERRLWLWTAMILVGIFVSLGSSDILNDLIPTQELFGGAFLISFVLVIITVLAFGIQRGRSALELGVFLGIAAVYLLVLVRTGTYPQERTHLIEYGVLAVFVLEAMLERAKFVRVPLPWLWAIVFASLIGCLDEFLQQFIPDRYFDPEDMLFNFLASLMAVGSHQLLSWVSRLVRKKE